MLRSHTAFMTELRAGVATIKKIKKHVSDWQRALSSLGPIRELELRKFISEHIERLQTSVGQLVESRVYKRSDAIASLMEVWSEIQAFRTYDVRCALQ